MSTAPDPFIIGLTGRAGAGKDTVAQYLVERYGFVQVSFAEPLREMVFALLEHANIDHAYVTERSLKEQDIPGIHISARGLLQTLGTEWGRIVLGHGFWVRILEMHTGLPDHPVHDRIVISDVRYANEAAWVVKQSGVVCGINREADVPATRLHASETQIPTICRATPPGQWETLDNNDTIGQLHSRIDSLCLRFGLDARD